MQSEKLNEKKKKLKLVKHRTIVGKVDTDFYK